MTDQRHVVAALAGFEHMTRARLVSLLNGRTATEAYALASGADDPTPGLAALFDRTPGLRNRWLRSAEQNVPRDVAERCEALGVDVVLPTDSVYPATLLDDPQRPAVLFVRGDLAALDRRRIAIVGTRNPTQRGLQTAARFGHELAAADVTVVSGLAKGIDGAAHRGALSVEAAMPVAVVANGHDAPYPKRHTSLWNDVGERGAVISEWPPGTPPDAYRFPLRNRILAALSEIVLVVESRERGGSLITARLAAERGVDVFAVPGAVGHRSSIGTNELIRDGAAIATEPDDLLIALGLDSRRSGERRFDSRPRPRGDEVIAIELCRDAPLDIEGVAAHTGWTVTESAMVLARLERSGWLCESGGWFETLDEFATLL